MIFIKIFISIFTLLIFLHGCSNISRSFGIDITNNKQQDEAFIRGDYNRSANLAISNIDKGQEIDDEHLLSRLKAGNSFLFAKEYKYSQTMFNEAERIIKYQHEQIKLQTSSQYITQLLLNDATIAYKANITDSIMLNTYKALAYMQNNEFDQARVELNRAIDRQRRAKNLYATLIQKQKEAIKKEQREGKRINISIVDSIAKSHYSNMNNFQAYPNFINPFTTYLAGLYFLLVDDYSKSIDLLKEASAMTPKNNIMADDFQMAYDKLSGKTIDKHYVWVIFENGLAPIKQEVRLNIPVFLVSDKVSYVGIALPKLTSRYQAFNNININSSEDSSKTYIVADMDRVIKTEFKYGYKYIITRAILSATLKGVAQYQASKSGGEYASLAMGFLSALTTHADTRSWTTLPKDFQISKIKIPKDKKLSITYGLKHYNLVLDQDIKSAIVYVRIPTSISSPSISIINFKE